jgi:hypothetical protein
MAINEEEKENAELIQLPQFSHWSQNPMTLFA